ncbi:hypothetical protein HDF15_001392 [Granulicella mallensis]|uniref:Uncharacterized protein n=1 Tax=Granulicella mallensis TaxID=940614 RepID=A0A7W7ZNC1_9BACT|nr:hypothetical protein [Granulicella mallensis]
MNTITTAPAWESTPAPHLPLPNFSTISIIDTDSSVRRVGFTWPGNSSVSVAVFYSVESFLRSHAAASTDLLILGHTHSHPSECESILWVAELRPDLKVVLLNGEDFTLRRLSDLREPRQNSQSESKPSIRLAILSAFLSSCEALRPCTHKQPQPETVSQRLDHYRASGISSTYGLWTALAGSSAHS